MSDLDERLAPYMKIYDDVDEIFNSKPIYVIGKMAGRTSPVTDDRLEALAQYARGFDGEKNNGKLRTILIILKPYRDNPIIKDTADLLANQLRSRSKNGFI